MNLALVSVANPSALHVEPGAGSLHSCAKRLCTTVDWLFAARECACVLGETQEAKSARDSCYCNAPLPLVPIHQPRRKAARALADVRLFANTANFHLPVLFRNSCCFLLLVAVPEGPPH
jgi:hypothetical protein